MENFDMETLRTHLQEGQVIPRPTAGSGQCRRFFREHPAGHHSLLSRRVGWVASRSRCIPRSSRIREPKHGLFRPVLELAEETIAESLLRQPRGFVKIAGIAALRRRGRGHEGGTGPQSRRRCRACSVSGLWPRTEEVLVDALPAGGGDHPDHRVSPSAFRGWPSSELSASVRQFAEIPNAVAIKIAPFNRYQTLDVVRAVIEAGREDLVLYTGNDDTIVSDLFTPFVFNRQGRKVKRRIAGGLLGHWVVWTHPAVRLFRKIKEAREEETIAQSWFYHRCRGDGYERSRFRCAQSLFRVHPGHPGGLAPPGAHTDQPLFESSRNAFTGPSRGGTGSRQPRLSGACR